MKLVQILNRPDFRAISMMLLLNVLELIVMRALVTGSSVRSTFTVMPDPTDRRIEGECRVHLVYTRPVSLTDES